MIEETPSARPIVLIHGLWTTPRSWDRCVDHYRAEGHEAIAPAYPGFEIEVEGSNAKRYRNSEAATETYEFPDRSHFTGVEPGWEQVADYALEWATSHAQAR